MEIRTTRAFILHHVALQTRGATCLSCSWRENVSDTIGGAYGGKMKRRCYFCKWGEDDGRLSVSDVSKIRFLYCWRTGDGSKMKTHDRRGTHPEASLRLRPSHMV